MKRLAPLLLACLAALLLAQEASAESFGCGLPDTRPLWVEFSDGSVGFREALFGKPGIVVATNGVDRAAELRSLGAQTVYWHMFLKGLVGTPTAPNDPALVQERAEALVEKARESTGCETPVIGLNELNGVWLPTPWPANVVQYRANVLQALQILSGAGAKAFLLVPGQARGARAPYVGDAAADWWRQVAGYASIVREMHFNAPYIFKLGPIVGPRTRRMAMRDAIGAFTGIGISAERMGLLLGFQSGPGKGGREGLQPSSAWFDIVKQDALAAHQVASELGLSSVWSWGWGTFNAEGADPDKPAAACVYLWARDSSLCDGPAAAGPGFDASLTEGQIDLPAGIQCSTAIGDIPTAAVDELFGVTGDRTAALTALLTRLVYDRYGGAVSGGDVARGEDTIVQSGFGGDYGAYEAELASRGLNRKIARGIIADDFRRQAIAAQLAVRDAGSSVGAWVASKHREALRSAICLGDEVPSKDAYQWGNLLPFLELPEASVTIAAGQHLVRKGASVLLAGAVASTRASEKVTIWGRGINQVAFAPVGTAKAAADGRWALEVAPRAKTTYYRAISLSAASPTIAVKVKGKR